MISGQLWMFCTDDGGGMDPESIRKCMSLGYSSKKSNTTIGQCNYHEFLLSFTVPCLTTIILDNYTCFYISIQIVVFMLIPLMNYI